jgi:glycosyltransferase involved in cell wall biosynthesis
MSIYNGERYLRDAVESILRQSFSDVEFVIVDDSSTDSTPEVLDMFDDLRIVRLRNEKNVGVARSLNRGVQVAQGEYIARQDADDISQPKRLLEQAGYLDQNPRVGVVGTATAWIDAEGRWLEKIWPTGGTNAELQALMLSTCPLVHGSTMYRRRSFDEVGGYESEMRTGQDYDFWLRVSESWDLVCLPHVLYQYRRHERMLSKERQAEQHRNANLALTRAIERRLTYGYRRIGVSKGATPKWLQAKDRRWLAEQYVFWSGGARGISRRLALQFLAIALVLDPTTTEIWSYVADILGRKLGHFRR